MRPLNLTPPEDRRGDSAPLRAGAVSYAIVGLLAAALVAVVALVLTSNDINDSKSQLASLEAPQAAAQQAAAALAPYDEFASLASTRNATVSQLARSRFDWERVLQELALVIPDEVTLTSIDANATGGSAAAGGTTDTSSITGPSLALAGCANGQEGTAQFLAALRDIDGVTRVGMQSSTLNDAASTSGGPGAVSGSSNGCEASRAANFSITVAFDAVPAPPTAATGTETVPATTTTPTETTDTGVAETENEQQGAEDSAANQSRKARNTSDAVGVTK